MTSSAAEKKPEEAAPGSDLFFRWLLLFQKARFPLCGAVEGFNMKKISKKKTGVFLK